MMDTRAIIERITKLIHPEVAKGGITSVYLFGSTANERRHQESDIDLAVLLDWEQFPDRASRFDLRLRLITLLEASLETEVDVVVLNDVPSTFARAIFYEGKRILTTNEEADRAWSRDVQLRAPDLERWLKRMRAIKLEALES